MEKGKSLWTLDRTIKMLCDFKFPETIDGSAILAQSVMASLNFLLKTASQ